MGLHNMFSSLLYKFIPDLENSVSNVKDRIDPKMYAELIISGVFITSLNIKTSHGCVLF